MHREYAVIDESTDLVSVGAAGPKEAIQAQSPEDSGPEAAPFDIATFAPRCTVCTKLVPEKRAKGKYKTTCSPECHKVIKKFGAHLLELTRCPACWHPSTPEQRADFKAWRKERGYIRAGAGRPPVNREAKLQDGLRASVGLLEAFRDALWTLEAIRDPAKIQDATQNLLSTVSIAQLDSEISRFKKLLPPIATEPA